MIFTGFLDYANYISLLEKVDAVMVLTKEDYTLCCQVRMKLLGLWEPSFQIS